MLRMDADGVAAPPQHVELATTLVVRESTAPLRENTAPAQGNTGPPRES
jgi:hypothetical protein